MRDHARAFARYLGVGAVATAAHYLLLAALVELAHWYPPAAAAAGAVLGAQVAFVGNRAYTFGHRGPLLGAWWRFQATAVIGALVSAAAVAIGDRAGLHYLIGQMIGTGLAVVLTYAVNRAWSFRHRPAS